MVTADISARFTAEQALLFLNEARSLMTDDELYRAPVKPIAFSHWDETERWNGLPPHLVKKWGVLRELEPPYFMRQYVQPLCRTHWGLSLTTSTRKYFRYVSNLGGQLCLILRRLCLFV